jgi:phosphoenolpyruvate carboxykinase (ATP)
MPSNPSTSAARQPESGGDLRALGIEASRLHWNAPPAALYEEAVRRGEGILAAEGPLVCLTGAHTGRSPNDKFIVRTATTEPLVAWGKVNRALDAGHYDLLERDLLAHLSGRELFVQDCRAGADPAFALPIRVVTEYAWHSLFARHLFIDVGVAAGSPATSSPTGFTVIDAPSFVADPVRHGTSSGTCIVLNFDRRLVLIGGTQYAGEIKKSIFTAMNYLLPPRGVLPMHCSANVGRDGDVALFFGLSGTGKTTLSSDVERQLIGDDEHGWSDAGVFNIEGGCYAKTIRLSAAAEPQIHATTRRFGTVLENVVVDPATRRLDLDSDAITENTRGAYPLDFIDNHVPSGVAGHPAHIVMLTADAFGCLPPISRLTSDGAMYHFLSGYTAKVAGTERGVTEPKATFSACFGAPFLPLSPQVYAALLGERIARHDVRVWLVNTGWSGGPHGVGARMSIAHTRAMIRAALGGALDTVDVVIDPIFNLAVPVHVPGVPDAVLTPRATWPSAADYDNQARRLAGMFAANFAAVAPHASPAVRAAGPRS